MPVEAKTLERFHWWPVAALKSSDETFTPTALADIVSRYLSRGRRANRSQWKYWSTSPAACRWRRAPRRRDRASRRSGCAAAARRPVAARSRRAPSATSATGSAGDPGAPRRLGELRRVAAGRRTPGIGTVKTWRASPAKGAKKPAGSLVFSMPQIRKSGRATRSSSSAIGCGDHPAGARIVAAVEPELGIAAARSVDQPRRRSAAAAAPASRRWSSPVSIAPVGDARDRPARSAAMASAGIGELVAAEQPRQRQVEQAVLVLVDEPAALARRPSKSRPPIDAAARPSRAASRSITVERRVALRRDDRRAAALEDAGLLAGDLLDACRRGYFCVVDARSG